MLSSSAIISCCLLCLCFLAGSVIGESPLCRRISSGEHGSLAFASFTVAQSKLTFVESGRTYSGLLGADHRLSQLVVEKTESPTQSDSPGSTYSVWRHTLSFANEQQLTVQLTDDGRTVKVQVTTINKEKPGEPKIFMHEGEKRRLVLHKVIANKGKGYAFFETTKGQPVIGMLLLGDLLHRVPKNDKLPPTSSADTYLAFLSNGTLLSPFLSSSSYYVMSHLDNLGSVMLIRKVSATMSASEVPLFSGQVPVGFLTAHGDVFLLDLRQGVVCIFKYVSDLEKQTGGKQVKLLARIPFWRFFGCKEPSKETIDPEQKPTKIGPSETVSPEDGDDDSFVLWIVAGLFLFIFAMLLSGIIIGYCSRSVEQRLDAHHSARFGGFTRRRHRQPSPSASSRSRRTGHRTKRTNRKSKTPKRKNKTRGDLKTPSEKGWWDSTSHSSSSHYPRSLDTDSGSLQGTTGTGAPSGQTSTRDMATQTWKGNFGNEKSTSEGTASGGINGSDSDDLAKCWAKK